MALQGINVSGTTYQYDYNALANKPPTLPTVTSTDNGKILQVDANGEWAAVSLPNAEEATF